MEREETLMQLSHKLGKLSNQLEAGTDRGYEVQKDSHSKNVSKWIPDPLIGQRHAQKECGSVKISDIRSPLGLGRMSTTTTIIDGKNGSVPSSSMKVGKKSVTEDLVTTFSSPAAWILVVALIVTWSAVAIVMFDLVDYKAFAGRSVNKLSTEPLRIIHQTLEESTDWLYGFISFLSDIVWSDDDDGDEGEVEPSLKKVIHRDKPEKQEKVERKEPPKVTQKDKRERQEKLEKKERHTVTHKEKPEKPEKHEKKTPSKVIQKDKPERHEKAEKKPPPKEEKKVKSTKVEAKVKKEVKDGKGEGKTTEKVKQAETKTTEVGLIKAKPKVKEEKALQTITKSEKKDQYAFCRYVIDMFAQGDFYPGGIESHGIQLMKFLYLDRGCGYKFSILIGIKSHETINLATGNTDHGHISPVYKPLERLELACWKQKGKEENRNYEMSLRVQSIRMQAILKSLVTGSVEMVHITLHNAGKAKTSKKETKVHASVETLKSKAVPGKKEEKTNKAAEQDPGKEKELKSPAATKDKEYAKEKEGKNPTSLKDKEHAKEKEGKNPTSLKDKDSLKGKNPKNPEGSKEKETSKRTDVKPSAALKEKAAVKKEEEKKAMCKCKTDITKSESFLSTLSLIYVFPSHNFREEPMKPSEAEDDIERKLFSYKTPAETVVQGSLWCCTDPDEQSLLKNEWSDGWKVKFSASLQNFQIASEKSLEHEHVKHEKAISKTKPEKPIEKKHLKEEKSKGVPPVKEVPQHHNLTSAPVRYFQCVFLNGPNGFGLQFPTNPPSNKEEKTHSKASKRKTRKPGQ
ncbi:hypothetical protein Q9966_014466 [Columba livia]|nr:hypothetical protein Q9966_014466 [Columba livia]